MSQISPPIRIFLVLTIAVLGVYMLFLRPKPEEVPPLEPATTSTSEPVEVSPGETAAGTATTQEKASEPTAAAAAEPTSLKGLPKPVRRAIRDDKVLVVLFWNEKAADDRSVRKSLRKVNTWDDRVFVHAAPLKQISRYGRIARGVNVEQSPTIVIADRDLKAETLVGYVDRTTIDQAVLDALRNSSGEFTSAYLRQADAVCTRYSNKIAAVPFIYTATPAEADRRLKGVDRNWAAFTADFKAIDAPKKWRSFHNASVADIEAYGAAIHRASVAVGPKTSLSAVSGAHAEFVKAEGPLAKSADKRFDGEGLFRCGSHF